MITGCGGPLSTPPACARSIGLWYVVASAGALCGRFLTSVSSTYMALVYSVCSFKFHRIPIFAILSALVVWLESCLESAHAHPKRDRAFREVGPPRCPDQSATTGDPLLLSSGTRDDCYARIARMW